MIRTCRFRSVQMILIEDTRNQIGKHDRLNADLTKLGHKVVRSKLFVGDYSKIDDMSICIDTKRNWEELAGNICGAQHIRFRAECIRAQENGIQLVVLIEESVPVIKWKARTKKNGQPVCRVSAEVLAKAMGTMSERYGVVFCNCDKTQTAELMIKILNKNKE